MRAVNLIPHDGARGGAGGGIGLYALLGVLGVLLAGVLAYVLTNNTLVERRAEVAALQTQAQAAQAQAEATRPYREFAALAEARVATVRELGRARFDWHRAFDEIARVMPDDVWLTSLLGTVTTGVSVEGAGSGTTGAVRGALPNPAIELTGCTTGHAEVARLISRLRLMTGVVRVSLSDSAKAEANAEGGGGAGGGQGGDCRNGNEAFPQFGVVVFFEPPPTVTPPADPAAAGATAQPASGDASSGTPTPASSGGSAGSDMR
jgi:Tfp pilus assembly protein PilN